VALWFPLLPACRSCAWLLLRSAVLTRCCSVVPSFCQAEVHKAEAAAAKKELEKFKDVMSGVRAASRDFNASGLGRTGVISGTRRSAASPVHLEEVAPRRWATWHWEEDAGRIDAHDPSQVTKVGGKYFVRYANGVSSNLENDYQKWMSAGCRVDSAVKPLDLTGNISSTGTEEKAHGKDSGTVFEIDFVKMVQRNVKTKFERPIHRVQAEAAAVQAAPMVKKQFSAGKSMMDTMGAVLGGVGLGPPMVVQQFSGAVPEEFLATDEDGNYLEDFLILFSGQLLQTSKTRPDGWAYGKVILDTVENRANPGIDGVSIDAGWFPLSYTNVADSRQLAQLQKKMGSGATDALSTPAYWDNVADPMTPELTLLDDGDEKRRCVQKFMSTLPPSVKVVDVQRVQNVSMWQSYAVKRSTIFGREKNKDNQQRFERVWLFHGTDEDTVPKIYTQGFNRSFCGKNATAFGKGVYFARDAAYSSSTTYSRPNAQRIQHMFLCRVTVGEYCSGVRDALTPGVREGNLLYDSTVNSMSDPSIYVTYHDAQAYPEYLVRFTQ